MRNLIRIFIALLSVIFLTAESNAEPVIQLSEHVSFLMGPVNGVVIQKDNSRLVVYGEPVSVIENAEMVMRASIERKESRRLPSRFFRVDYPDQDDANFLCFLSQKSTDGKVRFTKIKV